MSAFNVGRSVVYLESVNRIISTFFTFLNKFYLQGLDAITAILDLNSSEVLTTMDVSPATAMSTAQ